MKKLIRRWKLWREWLPLNGLTKAQQILVLLGLRKCTHFEGFLENQIKHGGV